LLHSYIHFVHNNITKTKGFNITFAE